MGFLSWGRPRLALNFKLSGQAGLREGSLVTEKESWEENQLLIPVPLWASCTSPLLTTEFSRKSLVCPKPLGTEFLSLLKKRILGQPGWLSGLQPPSAQGVILETRDQVPH